MSILADFAPALDLDVENDVTAADRAWWAAQNVEFHTLDEISPETDGVDAWTLQLVEHFDWLEQQREGSDLPAWVCG